MGRLRRAFGRLAWGALLLLGCEAEPSIAQEAHQVTLTQQQIDGVIGVEREIAPVMKKLRGQQLALGRVMIAAEKKYGFASDDAFADAAQSVQRVMNGIDPDRKAYVGPDHIKSMIALLERTTSLPEYRRLDALNTFRTQLKDAIAAGAPPPGNIELVVKNYDRLHQAADALADGQ